MTKDKIKDLVIAIGSVVIVLLILFIASGKTSELSSSFEDIKLIIDGKQAVANGKNGYVDSVVAGSEIFLPASEIAETMNMAVTWDKDKKTLYFGEHSETQQPSSWLKDMETFTGAAVVGSEDELEIGSREYDDKFTSNTDTVYKNYWYPDCSLPGYFIDCNYSQFKGSFYLSKSRKAETNHYRLVVYGDERILYTSPEVTSGVAPVDFTVDITNVVVIKLEYQTKATDGQWVTNIGNTFPVYVGNARFYK